MSCPSRREFAAALAPGICALGAELDRRFPSDFRRFSDPATEFEVTRLTDPAYSSRLTAYYNRAISKRGTFLLFSCDRTGSQQVFRMDLKTGETRQLTQAAALDPSSVALGHDDRTFFYFDGASLRVGTIGGARDREVHTVPEGWTRCPGFGVSVDGLQAAVAERKEGASRLQLVSVARRTAATIAEVAFAISHPQPRPKRAQVLFRQENEALWLVNFDGAQRRPLRLAPGVVGPAQWSPDGRTVLYLNFPEDRSRLNSMREITPDENTDKMIGPTSQFVAFSPNADSSVFVGASRNVASPHILILLRVTRRELTLCEHRAADPAMAAPVFSPDSQRIYFHSDKHGKFAIYSMPVERFVEKTEEI